MMALATVFSSVLIVSSRTAFEKADKPLGVASYPLTGCGRMYRARVYGRTLGGD